ncbi:unnamed protein product [Miscanthus lutarioriparius]|uniref:Uncharacterized protein n=1 Tax=Miscanthus lutarioriparius TaxID=422564 RepID=A0A811SHX0_9POAL|nr:unnamed protein product [Miscanthus lutarioriparius]
MPIPTWARTTAPASTKAVSTGLPLAVAPPAQPISAHRPSAAAACHGSLPRRRRRVLPTSSLAALLEAVCGAPHGGGDVTGGDVDLKSSRGGDASQQVAGPGRCVRRPSLRRPRHAVWVRRRAGQAVSCTDGKREASTAAATDWTTMRNDAMAMPRELDELLMSLWDSDMELAMGFSSCSAPPKEASATASSQSFSVMKWLVPVLHRESFELSLVLLY